MEKSNERKGYPVTAAGYKLLEEIGQGVSATVYRALCLPFNEVVAIKSLDLEKCTSNLDGIRREAQMMSLISHPNVVKAYCSFVVEQALWVVMPYMAGGSCLHIMKSAYPDGFDEPVIATVLKSALKALEYLHRHGHIHRDVKAGNILVDANGAIKLGDFGVSACMFDTGDRQRSRNTFVGTPCWMAPEVMEQLHGYDFKADIWSFGITGLELAHGHAPFSKYPPMKVLLMTLQNAPPGLDYERDKRFSKLFKEMIAMCLVKDPAKRPSAEKLLKHSFFKHARNHEYITRHVLDGLPSLGERVMNLKSKDAVRLAQKKIPSGEWEERSQNEYKRGVSSWNFNVEDLKAQAALIEDDEVSAGAKEDNEVPKVRDRTESEDSGLHSAHPLPSEVPDVDRSLQSCTAQPSKGDTTPIDARDRTILGRSESFSTLAKFRRTLDVKDRSLSVGKRESRHIGRFDVLGSAPDLGNSYVQSHKASEQDFGDGRQSGRRDDGAPCRGDDRDGGDAKDHREFVDREQDRVTVGGGGTERSMSRTRDEDKDRDRESRQAIHTSEDKSWTKLQFWERGGAAVSSAPVTVSAGNKEVLLDEKPKGGIVQKKGRFSVTSEGVDTTPSDKEREHMLQITDLQARIAILVDELQAVKLRNAELERQLKEATQKERGGGVEDH